MAVFGKAQYIKRVEDQRLLTGQGGFADNLVVPEAVHLVLLRSPHAHARIVGIDAAVASRAAGVVAVYTWEDMAADGCGAFGFPAMFPNIDGNDPDLPASTPLANREVRHVGEAVAAVIADTRAHALDAADLVEVDYEPLSAVINIEEATAPGASQVFAGAPGNLAGYNRIGDADRAAVAFAAAARIVKLDIRHQRLIVNAMEPRAITAEYAADSGRIIINEGSQQPQQARDIYADVVLKMPKEMVRVLVKDMGGGFGMKTGVHPDEAVCAWVCKKLERTVKWRNDRAEEFMAANAGRDQHHAVELALDGNNRILALRMEAWANIGAYPTRAGVIIPLLIGPKVMTGTYNIPVIDLKLNCVITNTTPIAAYRGAGRPECIFDIERLMDTAAREIGVDPAELRRINFVKPDEMPYTTAGGEQYDTGDFNLFLDKVLLASDWSGFPARKAKAKEQGKLYGRGLASYIEWTSAGVFSEMAHYEVRADGKLIIWMGIQAMGQGLQTSFTQLASEQLGIDPDRIEIAMGDSDTASGIGSMGSRSAYIGGSAVQTGSQKLIDRSRELAADALEADVNDVTYDAGRFKIIGTDRSIDLFELAGKQPEERIYIENINTVDGIAWPNGSHVAEVEIDPETGKVEIVRYTTVDDVGRPIHRPIVFGQIHGGCAQGIGQALMEEAVYDSGSGQLLTASFMDYTMPRAIDFPDFNNQLDDTVPAKNNPLGAKGVGESGTVGSAPTIVNAIMDALWPIGVRNIQMPATPLRVWQAIQEAPTRAV